jgi:hypothetical protein
MNLVRILLLVFLVYAALKQKSEESRNVILIVTGLLAVCMMNKEGYLVKCNEADSAGHFTTSSAPGSCRGQLLPDCDGDKVRHAETGACQNKATPPADMKSCVTSEECCGSNAECTGRLFYGDKVRQDADGKDFNVCSPAGLLGARTKTCTCSYSPSNTWTEGANNNCAAAATS